MTMAAAQTLPDQKAANKAKFHAKLVSEYGLTKQQMAQVDALVKTKREQLKAVKALKLPPTESHPRKMAVNAAYREKLQKVMTADQFAKFTANKTKHEQEKAQKKAVLTQYRQEVNKIDLPVVAAATAQTQLIEKYETSLASFIGLEAARKAIYKSDVNTARAMAAIRGLQLPKKTSRQMGKLKVDYDRAFAALQSQVITPAEKKSKRQELEENYNAQVHDLIGDAPYSTWLAIHDGAQERYMMGHFGFTREQYLKYVEIENSKAVEILAAKQSNLPLPDKQAKVQAAKDKKAANLQAILTPDQFNKWRAYNIQSEAQAQQNRANKRGQ